MVSTAETRREQMASAFAGQLQRRRPKQQLSLDDESTNYNTAAVASMNSTMKSSRLAVVLAIIFLTRPSITANAWVVPNTPRSQLSVQKHPRQQQQHKTGTRTRKCPLPSVALRATIEDNKSSNSSSEEEQSSSSTPPRRTRRIDDILEEYEETGDAGLTISVLESSLKREQQKSSTLEVRLHYAEQVIAEQKKRLEAKRSSLQKKTQALSETQKRLNALEQQLRQGQLPPPAPPPGQLQNQSQAAQQQQAPWQQPPLTSTERQYPLITNWSVNGNTGEVTGTVSCHPSIPDGTTIVTSGLDPESFAKAGDNFVYDSGKPATVVTTRSGSMYQLGVKKAKRTPPPRQNTFQQQQQQHLQQQQQIQAGKQQLYPSSNLKSNLEFPLTGQSISNGRGTKYLLAGQPMRKPSGRSEIIMAYKCDDSLQSCDSITPYVVKLSTHKDKLQREYDNYRRVQEQTSGKNNGGWIGGAISNMFDQQQQQQGENDDPFVTCYDFLPVCEGSIKYAQHSAIVLEKGHEDLRDFEYNLQVMENDNNPSTEYPSPPVSMDPSLVRSSLLAAAKCLQVLHSRARLVWTDLKAENLIFMRDRDNSDPSKTTVEIKGVDLESAIPHRGNPIDYTPEVCPPEFAQLHLRGNPYDFVLDYSYDVWSFGMVAYELATGSAYFRGKTPSEIMAILGDPNFVPPLEGVDASLIVADAQLVDLIRACLKVDPRRRVSVRNIVQHPYFQQHQRAGQPAPFGDNGYGSNTGGTFW